MKLQDHIIEVQNNQKQEFLVHKRIARVRAVSKYSYDVVALLCNDFYYIYISES